MQEINTGPLAMMVGVLVMGVNPQYVSANDEEKHYSGNFPCSTDSNCPQYAKCGDYIDTCTKDIHGNIGNCSCFDADDFGLPCHCVDCEIDDEPIETNLQLCYWVHPDCETDDDCDYEPGLECRYSQCFPSHAGHLPCQTSEDCHFGWDCVDNPPSMMSLSCISTGDAVGSVSEDDTNSCCWSRVCTPHGYFVPIMGCVGGGGGGSGTSGTGDISGDGSGSITEETTDESSVGGSGGCGVVATPTPGADLTDLFLFLFLLVTGVALFHTGPKTRWERTYSAHEILTKGCSDRNAEE